MSARRMKRLADLVTILKAYRSAPSADPMYGSQHSIHSKISSTTIHRVLAALTKSGRSEIPPEGAVDGVQAGWFLQPYAARAPVRPA